MISFAIRTGAASKIENRSHNHTDNCPLRGRSREGAICNDIQAAFFQVRGRITSTMFDLASKTCVPCRGGVLPLKGEELAALEAQVDGWNVIEGHHIKR
jgi:hypothetical protein